MTPRMVQNLKRSVVSRLRMELAVAGNPNCVLLTVAFQLVKVTWFRRLVESIRKSRLNRPSKRKVRAIAAFKVN